MTDQVVVFIDSQNTYKGAREAFFSGLTTHFTDGQFDPMAIGRLLIERSPPEHPRTLKQVRVYTGRPDASKQPKSYGPHMRQCAAWKAAEVAVIWKPLRYPFDFPQSNPEEKGVDVQLAVDFVTLAADGFFDVGIVFSTDTDLRPALEMVARQSNPGPRVELAAWRSSSSNRRIFVDAPRNTWCHYLKVADYEATHDPTDYTRP